MRIFLFTIFGLASSLGHTADPPNKRGKGFFGFGARPSEQISSALFPQAEDTAPAPTKAHKKAQKKAIFREGEPAKVDPISYTIEDGQRIEQELLDSKKKKSLGSQLIKPLSTQAGSPPASVPLLETETNASELLSEEGQKRRGWFGFGKRSGSSQTENPLVDPIPPSPRTAAPAPNPATEALEASAPLIATDVQEGPSVAETKSKTSWIPFLNRKKRDTPTPKVVPSPETTPAVAETITSPSPKPSEESKPASKPAEQSTDVATFEIRRDESQASAPKKAEKSERDGGILTPITKIRPPRKQIDLSSAETIIQDGEIITESESAPMGPTVPATNAPRQAPSVVNGVKTYSSWDDVAGRSSSVADRIIKQIR